MKMYRSRLSGTPAARSCREWPYPQSTTYGTSLIKRRVDGLLRPDAPTRGPPFVPSRITRMLFFSWATQIPAVIPYETAQPASPMRNRLRLYDIGFKWLNTSIGAPNETEVSYRHRERAVLGVKRF